MKRTLLVALVAFGGWGCGSKNKVKECDELVALAEKFQTCDKIPASTRDMVARGFESIRNALKMLEDAGDVPKDQLDMLAKTCKSQVARIRESYDKVAPECLK